MLYFLLLNFFCTCYEIQHKKQKKQKQKKKKKKKKSLILCFLDEFQKGFNLDAILYVNFFFVAENIFYYYYCTGQKYPNPLLGLRPKHDSIITRTRPHASPGPIWTK